MKSKKDSVAELDSCDRKILKELQRDAGLTNQELAERISLSPSPCLRRVQALEKSGVIRKRVALLDSEKLGLELTALIRISMDRHTPERFAGFEDQIRLYPEIQECYLIIGQEADYLVKAVVRDMVHFQELLLERLTRIEGVTGVHSSFVLRRVVDSTELPVL